MLQEETYIDELRFLDRQFVLVIYQDYKSISLRKLNDLPMNLLYFEVECDMTWSLYMHETSV